MNARLIIALLTSLLDDVIIVAIIVWGLPELGKAADPQNVLIKAPWIK